MVSCFAELCSHTSGKDECTFFRFPREPKQQALWMKLSRKTGKTSINDRRLCSCHFKDGKKENGPTKLFYNEEVLVNLVDSDSLPSTEEDSFIDDEKKLHKRKKMDTEACCFLYGTPCNLKNVHKKYKGNFKENINDTKTSANKDVDIIDITDEILNSSSDTLETSSNSVKTPLIPIKLGNSTIYKHTPSTTITPVNTYMKYHIQYKVPFPSDFFSSAITKKEAPLETTNCVVSTPLIQANAPLSTNKIENSPSNYEPIIDVESEEMFLDNLQSVQEEHNVDEVEVVYLKTNKLESLPSAYQSAINAKSGKALLDNLLSVQEENNVHELDVVPLRFNKITNSSSAHQPIIKVKSKITFSDNLQGVHEENNVHELDVDVIESRSINSVSGVSSASEQITTVTHAEAFCATQTLLRYMMNLDDVKISDINFILNLAQKIKKGP